MEAKKLFRVSQNGYNCEDVEQYISALKSEYKKVYEYAQAAKSNNDKLKRICLALSDENKSLKASNEGESQKTDVAAELESISALSEKLSEETAALKAKLL